MSYLGRVENKSSDIRQLEVSSSTSATHTLTWTAPNVESLIVTINGVTQQGNYTVSGVTLTLDTPLIVTDVMQVLGINDIGTTITPAQNSITNDMVSSTAAIAQSKLATLAIDTSEIADDAVTADKLANSINTEIAANTAKVPNATHTGDVTGATALTIAADAVDIAMLSATGTADATTFLRGDNAWAAAGGENTPAFMATFAASGSQTVNDNSTTKVEMSVEVFDTDDTYDPTTNYRWTPGVVGKYHIGASVYTEDNEIVRATAYIYKNGSQIFQNHQKKAHTDQTQTASPRHTYNIDALIDVTDVADYFEVYCWIDTSDGGTAAVQQKENTYFYGYRLLT